MLSPAGWEYWVAQAGSRRTAPVPVWVAALVLPQSQREGREVWAEQGFVAGLGEAGVRLGNTSPLPRSLSSPNKSMERGAASENEMQHVLCKYIYSTHTNIESICLTYAQPNGSKHSPKGQCSRV